MLESGPIRLLLVDDHPLVRDGLRARLSALEGLAVVGEAGGAAEAQAEALRCQPTLVLMDVGMREVNGIELAARLLGHPPGLGLECGRRFKLGKLGLIGMGFQTSPTLRDAMTLARRHPWSLGLLAEDLFASQVTVRRAVLGPDYAPLRVEFVHALPAGLIPDYEAFFRCPVQTGSQRQRLLTASSWLDRPSPQAHPGTWRLAQELLDRMALEQRPSLPVLPLSQMVSVALRRGLPHPPALAQLAEYFHLSERTLRRKPAEQGCSYERLLDDVRRTRAEELLGSHHLSLAQVAMQLGLTDARVFRRAFRRWTGRSPSEAREARERPCVGQEFLHPFSPPANP